VATLRLRLSLALLVSSSLMPLPVLAQAPEVDVDEVMRVFGRRAENDLMEITVIHLNDLTTDALFEAPAKYSLRAQARGATMFFVQGVAKDDFVTDLEFEVRTTRVLRARNVNVANFEAGTELSEGDEFTGIASLDELINLRAPFKLAFGEWEFDYTVPPNMLSQLDAAAGE